MMNKEIINKAFEDITPSDELVNKVLSEDFGKRRTIRVHKKAASIAAAFAAVLTLTAVSASALGFWNIADFMGRIFPSRNAAEQQAIEQYAFEANGEGMTEQYRLSMSNVVCDGNSIVTEFFITRNDGGKFTNKDFTSISFSSDLYFSDNEKCSAKSSGCRRTISDDGLAFVERREYSGLSREIKTGDNLCIKFYGAQELITDPETGGGNYESIDDGTVIFTFTIPEIPAPIPLEFKDENGEKVFEAVITPLSISAHSDKPIFKAFEEYFNPNEDLLGDYDTLINWEIEKPTTPKFYDKDMNLTETAYNGSKYTANSNGTMQHLSPDCSSEFGDDYAEILFEDDPNLSEAAYIGWFGCIAEIPDISETNK